MTLPQARRRCLSVDGREIRLSPQRHCVAETLLLLHPHPVPRDTLIERLWPNADDEPERSRNHISVLMAELRKSGVPVEQSRKGFGYRLNQRAA